MEESSTLSLWQGIVIGGPYVVATFYAMLFSFGLSLFLSFRRSGSTVAFACSIAPFVFGAAALWLGTVGLSTAVSGVMYEGNPVATIHLIQRPFILGISLSAIALIVYFLAYALRARILRA